MAEINWNPIHDKRWPDFCKWYDKFITDPVPWSVKCKMFHSFLEGYEQGREDGWREGADAYY